MTEAEWLACQDPGPMVAHAKLTKGPGGPPLMTDAQLRAWVEGCRAATEGDTGVWVHLSYPPALEAAVRNWSNKDGVKGGCRVPARAALLRCVAGNPFRPVTADPSCLTPDVLALARAALPACDRCFGIGQIDRNPIGGPDPDDGKLYVIPPPDVWECPDCKGTGRGTGLLDNARLAVLSDALEEAGCPPELPCRECTGTGRVYDYMDWQSCSACWDHRKRCRLGHVPHPLLAHLRDPRPHCAGCWALRLLVGGE